MQNHSYIRAILHLLKSIMKNYFLIIFSCLLYLGCQKIEKKDTPKYLATIENRTISEGKVDSIISAQVYQLRKNTLKTLLRSTIIELQAQKQKLSKEEFLKRKNDFQKTVRLEQYNQYLIEQGIDTKNTDTTKIVEYLLALNKQKHSEHFADSLLGESNIKINLRPDHYQKVITDGLDYHELSQGGKLIVYIISDYNCRACQNAEKRLRKIIAKYGKSVNFRYIYFSEYIDKKAIVAVAAANQDKFIEMHNFLFDHPELQGGDKAILELSKKSGSNMEMFEEDIQNPNTLKNLLLNKEKIIKQNIYVTPSFIINNKLINDEFSLYTLENLIDEELEK